jgi:hypothetical protein
MKPALTLALLLGLAAPAFPGTVTVRLTGVVGSNSLSVAPLAGQPSGSPVVVTFDVTTPGTPWPAAPANGVEHVVDPASFTLDVNGAVLGLASGGQVLRLINDFPAADGLQANVAGLQGGLAMTCELGFTGATFSSLDLTQQEGSYGFATLTSYNWLVAGSGVGALFIDFSGADLQNGVVGTPFCAGDGSLGPCPCGNAGAAGEGCANSSGVGAGLTALGTPSLAADDALFSATGLPAGVPSLLFSGTTETGSALLFGDGLRCAGGSLTRLGVRFADGGGAASWTGVLTATGALPGDRRTFQVWYRDSAGPCGGGFNASSGVDLTVQP